MRAKLISLLMGRANNRKKLAPKRPSRPLSHGVSTHSLWEPPVWPAQPTREKGATETPLSWTRHWAGGGGVVHKASPETQSLTTTQAVWLSILPLSGDTVALSTQPELTAFSGREAVRGKTRAVFEGQLPGQCIQSSRTLGRISSSLSIFLCPID